ncbi:PVR cell adhesion molecule related 2 like isoform X2 [Electrophorus electricus]|uniref:PVR cell adhesion molecule related 2 like isoform X2 n=1 Tax=Electrophorus electricus TaxID=8005 RepID=UPI0015D09475|nr:PVR cell adhesion molecule related 2 like isoform X2 [Electrophorus electricus]
MRNSWTIVVFLLCSQVVQSQRVRVLPEVEAYANESVNLHCEFTNAGATKLTQVSWIFEATEGQRENIAVYHPTYGQSFPQSAFKDRVQFTQPSLENPSIKINNVRMSDAGKYTCEYATYPSGNEQGTTTLIMLAKPKNSASPVAAQASGGKVVVARCEAAQGKPAATITWMTNAAGDFNITSYPQPDGTVTVRSEYHMAPMPADNGRDITCVITQQTQNHPQTFTIKLTVQYPPTVRIEGYDDNWYMGRTDAMLICHADANPEVVNVTWATVSGKMPPTVKVVQNKLLVQKVDESVNTTFICEAKNSLGSSKNQLTAMVTVEKRTEPVGSVTGAVIGGIIAVVILCLIGAAVAMYRKRLQSVENGDGPPKYKPPPPMKAGCSTEMLHKPKDQTTMVTETAPLSCYEPNYYDTTAAEPITDLDDENPSSPANGGTPSTWQGPGHPPGTDESISDTLPPYEPTSHDGLEANHGPPAAGVSRGESFVSAPMLV